LISFITVFYEVLNGVAGSLPLEEFNTQLTKARAAAAAAADSKSPARKHLQQQKQKQQQHIHAASSDDMLQAHPAPVVRPLFPGCCPFARLRLTAVFIYIYI
jgi:hypothetical protein